MNLIELARHRMMPPLDYHAPRHRKGRLYHHVNDSAAKLRNQAKRERTHPSKVLESMFNPKPMPNQSDLPRTILNVDRTQYRGHRSNSTQSWIRTN